MDSFTDTSFLIPPELSRKKSLRMSNPQQVAKRSRWIISKRDRDVMRGNALPGEWTTPLLEKDAWRKVGIQTENSAHSQRIREQRWRSSLQKLGTRRTMTSMRGHLTWCMSQQVAKQSLLGRWRDSVEEQGVGFSFRFSRRFLNDFLLFLVPNSPRLNKVAMSIQFKNYKIRWLRGIEIYLGGTHNLTKIECLLVSVTFNFLNNLL